MYFLSFDLSTLKITSVFFFSYIPTSEAVMSSFLRYKQKSPEVRYFIWTSESTFITGDYPQFRHLPDSGHSGN